MALRSIWEAGLKTRQASWAPDDKMSWSLQIASLAPSYRLHEFAQSSKYDL